MTEPERAKRFNPVVSAAKLVSIRRGEGAALAASAACLFAILAAYYVLKPIRSYVLQTRIGVDRKSIAILVAALFVAFQTLIYSRLVRRARRARLVSGTFVFALAGLALFSIALTRGSSAVVGYLYYAWVSGTSLLIVSQFWSVATEAWTHEQGVRLFGLIGVGAVAGAIGGNLVVVAFASRFGLVGMFAAASVLLTIAFALARWLLAWSRADSRPVIDEPRRVDSTGAISLVTASPYLAGIAAMTLLLNVVNTSNEWLLDKVVAARLLGSAELQAFYGRYMLEQNLLTFALQLLVTSPVQRKWGPRGALLILPTVSLVGGLAFMFAPTLGVIRALKVAENAAEYSIHSNTRELLYVPVSALERYSAKSFNDTFVVRAGDSLAAGVIFVIVELTGAELSSFGITLVTSLAVLLAVVAAVIVWRVTERHKKRLARATGTERHHLPAK